MALTKSQYQQQWYTKNADRINTAKRLKYASDPAYKQARTDAKARRYEDHRLHQSGLMTQGEYRAMVAAQDGLCKICLKFVGLVQGPGTGNYGLVVDHDHVTNKVRGLLCGQCNTAIGLLQDSPEICEQAAQYLIRSFYGIN